MSPSIVRWIRRGGIAAVAVMVVALAVGSFGDAAPDVASKGGAGVHVAEDAGDAASASRAAGLVDGPYGPAAVEAQLPPLGDRIVRTADLTVEIREGRFDAAWNEAFRIASRFGGQVMSASRGDVHRPLSRDERSRTPGVGDITLRVPSERFGDATNALRDLGVVIADSTSAQDVTEEYVDLQARLRHLKAEEQVLLGLFERAKSVTDTLAIQRRLGEVQAEAELVNGRIRFLDAKTDFSTVTLRLAEEGAAVLPPADEPTFSKAWDTAMRGLVRMGGAAMIAGVWLSPFALAALVALGVRRRARRIPAEA